MFLHMRNIAIQETSGLEGAIASITSLLPNSWEVRIRSDIRARQKDGTELVVEIQSPEESACFEVFNTASGAASIPNILKEAASGEALPPIYISDYIGPKLREALQRERISYADATGWVWVNRSTPLMCLINQGASKAPKSRVQSSIARLNGPASSRLIQTLCAVEPPIGVRELADLSGVAAGTVSKILSTLAAESIVERPPRGGVQLVRRRNLVNRWVMDYSFAGTNSNTQWLLDPRGVDHAVEAITSTRKAVFTGSVATRAYLPKAKTSVVPLRLVAAYTQTPEALAQQLGFIEAEPFTANVVLAVPQDARVLDRLSADTPSIAPSPLVLADLLTLPGRGVAEPTQLMDELAITDPLWKE